MQSTDYRSTVKLCDDKKIAVIFYACTQILFYWLCPHIHVVCGAASVKRYGERPSVLLSVHLSVPAWTHTSTPAAACRFTAVGPAGGSSDSDRLLQQQRANAGSATLSAYVVIEHRLY